MLLEQLKRGRPRLLFLDTVREYSVDKLRHDLQAGLTVGLIAIPQCMAYALIAGLSPIYGLYAGMVASVAGSLFGSSNHVITGPNGIVSLFVGNMLFSLDQFPTTQVVVYLALSTGLLQVTFSFLQVGELARFVSLPVMNGFMTGGAVVIIGDQLGQLLGGPGTASPYFFDRMVHYVAGFVLRQHVNPIPLLLGAATIACVYGLRWWHERLPAVLLTVVGFGGAAYLLGFETRGIELLGTIPGGLPALTLPDVNPALFSYVFGGAMALALLSSVTAVSISKSLAASSMDNVDENQELFGQGTANLACGLLNGFPGTASFSRSFLNYNAGARTRMAGVVAGGVIALAVSALGPFVRYIPMASLAGIIMVIAADIVDWEQIQTSLTTTRRDRIVFASTFLCVLLLKLDTAIYAGVIISLILYLRKASHIDMREYIVDERGAMKSLEDLGERHHPRIALIDINGAAFFGAADRIKERIQQLVDESPELKVIVLRMKNAMDLDITGAMTIQQIARMLSEQEKTLMISGATPHVESLLEESGATEQIGADKILVAQKSLLESTRQAIERAEAHIEAVYEGDEARKEENPPLKYTVEKKRKEEGYPESEDPLEEEKTGYHSNYDREG